MTPFGTANSKPSRRQLDDRYWCNRDLSVVVGNVCFQAVAKLTSTADMRAQSGPQLEDSMLGQTKTTAHTFPELNLI